MTHPVLTLIAAFAMMTLLWLPSLALRDVSIIDILWAPAFAILGIICFALAPDPGTRHFVVLALVSVWAIRLGLHIFVRWRKVGEDYRYAEFRRKGGANFPMKSLVTIFWLQALLLWIISWPLQAALDHPASALNVLDIAGMALAAFGIAFEAVADAQLSRFRADPENRGKVLNTGVWAWSRHPNYFGDFALWWGFYLIALAAGGPWWTVLGPIVMSALLIHYSGMGLLEDTIANRRPGYAEYVRKTSAFIPMPPR